MRVDPVEAYVSELYEDLRPLMFSIAYRMVGSVGDAEDIVQEAFLRFHRASGEGEEIESPKAYLSAITTRLGIDHLRSARVRREQYVGTWLPEPVLTDPESDVELHAETADSLSMAFLVLLESLSPVERAVFLLREVFEYGYDEIARVIGKTEDNCRQIAVRARRQVDAKRPRFEASRKRREELARRFFEAVGEGDTEGLIGLLAADVVAYGDGGGKAPATPHPIHGRERVARFLVNVSRRPATLGFTVESAVVNGEPGVVVTSEGRWLLTLTAHVDHGAITALYIVVNPDKLAALDIAHPML